MQIYQKTVLLLFLAAVAFGTTVTDGTRTCTVGSSTPCNLLAVSGSTPGTITITASGASTFALVSGSVGTLTTTSSTTATYTPPAHVVNKHQIGGCPVYANDSILNTDISSAPINSQSSTWLSTYIGTYGTNYLSFGNDLARLLNYATSSTPTRPFQGYYGSPSPALTQPWDPNRLVEGGRDVGYLYTATYPSAFTDHHILSVTTQSGSTDCTANETYLATQQGYYTGSNPPPAINCQDGLTAGCNAISMAQYPLLSYALGNSDTTYGLGASGLSELASYISLAELKSGSIKHVARIVLQQYAYTASNIWPAPSNAQGLYPPSSYPNNMPLGAWARLKSSYWNGTGYAPVCNSGNTSADTMCNTLVTQQQHYGGIVADGGSPLIGSSADISQDHNALIAVNEFSLALTSTNYDFIDVSGSVPSLTGTSSMQVNPTGSVTPSQFAIVNVTPSGGSASPVPILLQGIGIGIAQTQLNIPVGSTYQLSPWVEPSSASQTVTWVLTSSTGGTSSVSSSGLYTAPLTSTGISTAVLTGTSAADSSSTVTVYVTVYPYGADGTLRFAGWPNGANLTDLNGFTWYACCLTSGLNYIPGPGNIPTSVTPEAAVYNNPMDTYGNDLLLNTVVPNGNYQVRLLWSLPGSAIGCPYGACGTISPAQQIEFVPYQIEMNGLPQKIWFNTMLINSAQAYWWDTPVSTIVPAKVTNGFLTIRELAEVSDAPGFRGGGNAGKHAHLCGIQIIPDSSTTPHWAIDLAGNLPAIAQNTSLYPLNVTDWYTGVSTATPTWSVLSGPSGATINSSSGVLSLAAGTYFAGQPIVVQAANGSTTAQTTIYTTAAKYAINPLPLVNHYAYVRSLTIPSSKVSATQTNFPVAVSISDPTLATTVNGGNVRSSAGYDIVFASNASGTPTLLNWQVESYNSATGALVAHVLLPTVSASTNTVFYMFYGNVAINSPQNTSPASVWDSNFTAVYHLAANQGLDSTANGNNAIANNGMQSATGLVDGAIKNTASSGSYLAIPASVLNAASGTITAFGYPTQSQTSGNTFMPIGALDGSGDRMLFGYWSGGASAETFGWLIGSNDYRVSFTASNYALSTNAWHQFGYSWNPATPQQLVYLDGSIPSGGNVTSAFSTAAMTSLYIGTDPSNAGGSTFGGTIDEVRFSNIQRSSSWIATEYANFSNLSTFPALGAATAN